MQKLMKMAIAFVGLVAFTGADKFEFYEGQFCAKDPFAEMIVFDIKTDLRQSDWVYNIQKVYIYEKLSPYLPEPIVVYPDLVISKTSTQVFFESGIGSHNNTTSCPYVKSDLRHEYDFEFGGLFSSCDRYLLDMKKQELHRIVYQIQPDLTFKPTGYKEILSHEICDNWSEYYPQPSLWEVIKRWFN